MSDRKVKIESTVGYVVVISLPDMRFSRKFDRPLHSTMIPYDVIEEGLQRKGFSNYFKNGILRVVDKQDRIDLGLESEDDDYLAPIVSLTTLEMLELMRADDLTKLKETIDLVNYDVLDRFIQAAITSKIYNEEVIKILEKGTKRFGKKTNIAKLRNKAEELLLEVDDEEE